MSEKSSNHDTTGTCIKKKQKTLDIKTMKLATITYNVMSTLEKYQKMSHSLGQYFSPLLIPA